MMVSRAAVSRLRRLFSVQRPGLSSRNGVRMNRASLVRKESFDDLETELAMVARARTDRTAFAALYRANYAVIADYVYRRTGDVAATEDVLSEVFLAALEGLSSFEARG